MSDGPATACQAALRAALVADLDLAALVGARVLDEPPSNVVLPYVRFGQLTPAPDDTDGAAGWIVQVGLEAHSRPAAGRVEAARIMERIAAALHRRPQVLAVAGYTATECEVQTWTVTRAADGVSYVGTLALEIHLDS